MSLLLKSHGTGTSLLFLSALLFADGQTARTLIQKGKIAEAVREIAAALRDHPNDPETQFEAGQLLRELGSDRAAIAAARRERG